LDEKSKTEITLQDIFWEERYRVKKKGIGTREEYRGGK
jgi:hypothetical protein